MAASPMSIAWTHSIAFLHLTATAITHHFLPLLICAGIPAVERGYVRMRRHSYLPHGQLAAMEFVVLVSRLLLIWVALWATLSPAGWSNFHNQAAHVSGLQIGAQRVAILIGHHLRVVLWELVFFVAGFVLAERILTLLPGVLPRLGWSYFEPVPRQQILASVLRNLLLAPFAIIYVIQIFRPAFQ